MAPAPGTRRQRMWVISDGISRKAGGGEHGGKPSFKFGEELTGNLGHQESNGPRGRAGILIELVSVRAGASKAWTTRGSVLAAADWDPQGTGTIHSDLHGKPPPASQEPSRPLILLHTSIPPPFHPPCSCLPATDIIPKNPWRNPTGIMGTSVELGVGPTWPSLPSCWCHPSPVPAIHSPEGFPCQTRGMQHPHPTVG